MAMYTYMKRDILNHFLTLSPEAARGNDAVPDALGLLKEKTVELIDQVCIYVYRCVCVCVCVYICIYVDICIYIYIRIYKFIYIYIYIVYIYVYMYYSIRRR